jgi:hypothetical protein
MTKSEAYQLVRGAAAELYQNEVASLATKRAEFEQSYGSTQNVDASLVNDMRSLLVRVSALAQTNGKATRNAYGGDTKIPNKILENVARSLATGIGEIELHLAQARARSLFDAPSQSEYVRAVSPEFTSPQSWVGDSAKGVLALLEGVTIVEDPKPITGVGMKEHTPPQPPATCPHVFPSGRDAIAILEDDDTGVDGLPAAACKICDEGWVVIKRADGTVFGIDENEYFDSVEEDDDGKPPSIVDGVATDGATFKSAVAITAPNAASL